MILMRERCPEQGHNPVTHNPVDGALVAVDGFNHAFEHRVEELLDILRIAVGNISIDPLMSANSTVTCFRSPSRAPWLSGSCRQGAGACSSWAMQTGEP